MSFAGQTLPWADLPKNTLLACQLEPQHCQVANCVRNIRRHHWRALVRHSRPSNRTFVTSVGIGRGHSYRKNRHLYFKSTILLSIDLHSSTAAYNPS